MPLRKPSPEELRFISFLIREASTKIASKWEDSLMVTSMDDAGLGSLLLYPSGKIVNDREFGRVMFEVEFKDADNVPVVASLNLDQHGELFELDIWKVNFDPLIRFPDV
ncbi:MAG: hypothetical protein EOO89_28740 [Pedobacter sp.]|nr:MAG: hypothetical protein EOO89_28740 [Pedobacter sp.]